MEYKKKTEIPLHRILPMIYQVGLIWRMSESGLLLLTTKRLVQRGSEGVTKRLTREWFHRTLGKMFHAPGCILAKKGASAKCGEVAPLVNVAKGKGA